MPSSSEIFEIPNFYYLDSGNDYSGSKGEFAYKVVTGDSLRAMTWHGRKCSAKTDIEREQEFERTEDGFVEMIRWIEERYKEGINNS